jgi:hypothetical protein
VVAALGVGGIIAAVASSSGSATDYIQKHYKKDGTDQGTQVYLSPYSATQTAQQIAEADTPGDRRTTESGVFLRYPNTMIGVLVNPSGGSKVEVANQEAGYTHFYPFIGGFWGTYTGAAGSFRGGGPGTGK